MSSDKSTVTLAQLASADIARLQKNKIDFKEYMSDESSVAIQRKRMPTAPSPLLAASTSEFRNALRSPPTL